MKIFLSLFLLFSLLCNSSIGYADIKIYFSPNGGCQDAVVSEIEKAKVSINIAMYSFTSRQITQALLEAKSKNVRIRVVLDKGQKLESYSKSRYLIAKGFDVKYHNGNGLMHNKFAVIDGKVLITGSFNWTAGAEHRNEENLLVITDKDLSQKYADRFEYLWKNSVLGEAIAVNSTEREE
jgi:phosphatidylserine/phosphatidylglycerophosphate/cardiolipin synthase-like enzyme